MTRRLAEDVNVLHAVIMAGGSGKRFWPASRKSRPKQLLPLGSDTPLLRQTYDRLSGLVEPDRIWVVTTADLRDAVHTLLPEVPADNVLTEPEGRDTAACTAYAARKVLTADADGVCLVVPADHVIEDADALRDALAAGAQHVQAEGGLLTFGVRPARPETGYGYLKIGPQVANRDGHAVHELDRFIEKPPAATARTYLAAGDHLWNSGMFAWRAEDLLQEIGRQLPRLASGLERIAEAFDTPEERRVLESTYPELPRISVDYGIMEGAQRVWTLPVDFAWSDVGSWQAIWHVGRRDERGNLTQGRTLSQDCRRSLLISEGPVIAAHGLEDMVVIATGDAVLVLSTDDSQRVKEIVEELERLGWDDVL